MLQDITSYYIPIDILKYKCMCRDIILKGVNMYSKKRTKKIKAILTSDDKTLIIFEMIINNKLSDAKIEEIINNKFMNDGKKFFALLP
jgi:hypothetical protein